MKVRLDTERQIGERGIPGLDQKREPTESKKEEQLIVTADKFVADHLGTKLVHLVKGTVPLSDECDDCACDDCACDDCGECCNG